MKKDDISKYNVSRKGDYELLRFLEKCAANLQIDYRKSLTQRNAKVKADTKLLLDKCISLKDKVSNTEILDDCDIDTLHIIIRYADLKRRELFLIIAFAVILSIVSYLLTYIF